MQIANVVKVLFARIVVSLSMSEPTEHTIIIVLFVQKLEYAPSLLWLKSISS